MPTDYKKMLEGCRLLDEKEKITGRILDSKTLREGARHLADFENNSIKLYNKTMEAQPELRQELREEARKGDKAEAEGNQEVYHSAVAVVSALMKRAENNLKAFCKPPKPPLMS